MAVKEKEWQQGTVVYHGTKISIELTWNDWLVLHEMAAERLEHMLSRRRLPIHLMFYERIDAYQALYAAMLALEDPGAKWWHRGVYESVMACRKARHHILFLPPGKRARCGDEAKAPRGAPAPEPRPKLTQTEINRLARAIVSRNKGTLRLLADR